MVPDASAQNLIRLMEIFEMTDEMINVIEEPDSSGKNIENEQEQKVFNAAEAFEKLMEENQRIHKRLDGFVEAQKKRDKERYASTPPDGRRQEKNRDPDDDRFGSMNQKLEQMERMFKERELSLLERSLPKEVQETLTGIEDFEERYRSAQYASKFAGLFGSQRQGEEQPRNRVKDVPGRIEQESIPAQPKSKSAFERLASQARTDEKARKRFSELEDYFAKNPSAWVNLPQF